MQSGPRLTWLRYFNVDGENKTPDFIPCPYAAARVISGKNSSHAFCYSIFRVVIWRGIHVAHLISGQQEVLFERHFSLEHRLATPALWRHRFASMGGKDMVPTTFALVAQNKRVHLVSTYFRPTMESNGALAQLP